MINQFSDNVSFFVANFYIPMSIKLYFCTLNNSICSYAGFFNKIITFLESLGAKKARTQICLHVIIKVSFDLIHRRNVGILAVSPIRDNIHGRNSQMLIGI